MDKSVQDIYLDLIERSSFNSFDGPLVRRDLEATRSQWRACLMVGDSAITLRDLADNRNNVDSLLILTSKESAPTIYEMVKRWSPDVITVYSKNGTFSADRYADEDASYKLVRTGDQQAHQLLGSSLETEAIVFSIWWD